MASQKVMTLQGSSKRKSDEAPDASDSIEEQFGRRKPPEKGRFRLQVDRQDRKSTRLNSSHITPSRMPSSA